MGLYQMTGASDTVFCAEVVEFHTIVAWLHLQAPVILSFNRS
jgi:hypothetical protein